MKISWVNGVVHIECTPLEGKVLMQGANLMGHGTEDAGDEIVDQYAKDFGCTREELCEAIEECYTVLPHEDNPWWEGKEE